MRLTLLALLLGAAPLSAQAPDPARLRAATDSIAAAALAGGHAAGMVIAVVRGRDTLVLKGYGKADLEWDVPMPADAVFEIGSVTKQFTATALLQLVEAGRLSLDDDLSTHFPDYPLHGRRLPVRRLLDHTSGIRSYTSMREFRDFAQRTLPRDSLVARFAAEPFDFEPGAALTYNNSGYFLAGLLIEKLSGMAYGDYLQARLFAPAGLRDARYCDEYAVVAKRANGYDPGPSGLRRARFIVHTWPFAAGSICATAGDLVAWNRALHGGRLLSAAGYRELVTPGTLADGSPLRYAKGIVADSLHGRRALFHGGDIDGFASELRWFPDDSTTIAVLVNSQGRVRPQAIATAIGDVLYGAAAPRPGRWSGRPADYAGTYAAGPDTTGFSMRVTVDATGRGLAIGNGPQPPSPLLPLGGERFRMEAPGFGYPLVTFRREGGRVTALLFDAAFVTQVLRRR